MIDRKRQPVVVGARCVFGKGRVIGWVRDIRPATPGIGLRGSFMVRCDDGPTADDARAFTVSEWVDSAHIEMLS